MYISGDNNAKENCPSATPAKSGQNGFSNVAETLVFIQLGLFGNMLAFHYYLIVAGFSGFQHKYV